ncbi:DegT/DnrJ/EryC1/StrS family aminotransferase [Microvirga guangxiensis]|uniref:dTDP-4-amino-4,6-dideoxygalactose transaminase n=1 Tax=Microvirga guangxiensis TaxID=549386 RepID=A0A1G5GZJ2_9HYPH|nr:DegT/DnrJ/EryC1/StrS family aminotransferase [Microvirga guangxiensis]SCY57025.1 dTDP-4-amino-4,6-dideoxygalactose transaminase [Microvirga guangxiensis]
MVQVRPVPSMPGPSIASLLSRRNVTLPFPFDSPHVTFWNTARVALWQAVHALGLKAGQTIAVPAFCCGSEIDPFLAADLKLSFFAIGDDLSPDPASFEKATENASAAMVTHYLGFPADLTFAKDITRYLNIPLIEDCAHALYATQDGNPIGMSSDAAVFSLRKTVALPDGGALYLKSGEVGTIPAPPSQEIVRRSTRKLVSLTLRTHPIAVVRAAEDLRRRMKVRRAQSDDSKIDLPDEVQWDLQPFSRSASNLGMSSQALRLFRATDHEFVRASRRRNYLMLEGALKNLKGLRPMVPQLHPGACPLFFPILVDDIASLRKALAKEAVAAKHMWPLLHPAVPWERFSKERTWKEKLLGLPVHQALQPSDIDRLLHVVTQWSRG